MPLVAWCLLFPLRGPGRIPHADGSGQCFDAEPPKSEVHAGAGAQGGGGVQEVPECGRASEVQGADDAGEVLALWGEAAPGALAQRGGREAGLLPEQGVGMAVIPQRGGPGRLGRVGQGGQFLEAGDGAVDGFVQDDAAVEGLAAEIAGDAGPVLGGNEEVVEVGAIRSRGGVGMMIADAGLQLQRGFEMDAPCGGGGCGALGSPGPRGRGFGPEEGVAQGEGHGRGRPGAYGPPPMPPEVFPSGEECAKRGGVGEEGMHFAAQHGGRTEGLPVLCGTGMEGGPEVHGVELGQGVVGMDEHRLDRGTQAGMAAVVVVERGAGEAAELIDRQGRRPHGFGELQFDPRNQAGYGAP